MLEKLCYGEKGKGKDKWQEVWQDVADKEEVYDKFDKEGREFLIKDITRVDLKSLVHQSSFGTSSLKDLGVEKEDIGLKRPKIILEVNNPKRREKGIQNEDDGE